MALFRPKSYVFIEIIPFLLYRFAHEMDSRNT